MDGPSPSQRVVVVTGASSGIGRATAVAFAARGDWLVLAARQSDELQHTLELCGGSGRTLRCDVSQREQIAALASSVEAIEGRCDVLVNNAGIGARVPFDGPAALEVFDRVVAVNLAAPVAAIAYFLPLLRRASRPAIVNVSSVAGLYGLPGAPIYCASKFGLTGMSESLRASLADQGVRVTTIHPGPVPTEGWPHERLSSGWRRRLLATTPGAVARAIVRASEGRGSPSRVIPRSYATGLLLRALAPSLYRLVLRRAARRRLAPLPHEMVR